MTDAEDDIRRLMEVGNLVSPMALRVVVTLGLPSLIERNVHTVEELARATDTHPRVLRKILLHLATRGIFTRVGEDGFGLTSAGAQLLGGGSRAPLATSWDMTHVLGRVDLSTTRLLDVARTGRTSFTECFGRSLWQDLHDSATTGGGTELDALDAAAGVVEEDLIIDALDWSDITTVVDLGGGSGALTTALLTRYPHLHLTLVDRVPFVTFAADRLAAAGLSARSKIVAQDFLAGPPPAADLYVVSGVLSDWDDAHAAHILASCRRAGTPQARVLVSELRLLGADVNPFDPTAGSLRLETEIHNPDRTDAELERLAQRAGLRPVRWSEGVRRVVLELAG